MIIACLDTETSTPRLDGDLDIAASELIELGVVLYDSKSGFKIHTYCALFKPEEWSEESESIHKIPEDIINRFAYSLDYPNLRDVVMCGSRLIDADLIVAHRVEFDRDVLIKIFPELKDFKWLCSKKDLDHNNIINGKIASTRLMHLAVDYGIPVTSWHRALCDAEAVYQLCLRHDMEEALKAKDEPRYKLIASGPYNDDARQFCKSNGWGWDGNIKAWIYSDLKKDQLADKVKDIKKFDGWEIKHKKQKAKDY